MHGVIFICALLGTAGSTVLGQPAATQSAADGQAQPGDSTEAKAWATTLEPVVADLGSPDFERREAATEALKTQTIEALPELRRFHRGMDDHEVRLRIREVAEHIIYRDALAELGGFLGVQVVPPDLGDAKKVRIQRVVSSTAADQADLRVGDVIVLIRDLSAEQTYQCTDTDEFIRFIGSHAPGVELELALSRSGQTLTKAVILGYRPLRYLNPSSPEHAAMLQKAERMLAEWLSPSRSDEDGLAK